MSAAIDAGGLGVRFLFDRQQRLVTPGLARLRRSGTHVWGIRGVDVSIGPGAGVALVGPSGAGKTTLLRTIAGILPADEGWIAVRGRVGSLLSVEAGLTSSLTGRENAIVLGALMGLTAPREPLLAAVKARSGLGDAFERPVASYSQGMQARLGCALIQAAEPDVLLLDEVHEALDHEFRGVLREFAADLLARGGIVVAAGHDHELASRVCGRALLLVNGGIRADGSFDEVRALVEDEPTMVR